MCTFCAFMKTQPRYSHERLVEAYVEGSITTLKVDQCFLPENKIALGVRPMTDFSPEKEKPEDLLACAKPLNDPFASWNSFLGYITEDSEDEDVDLGEEFSAKPMATSAAKRIKIRLKDSVATNQVSSFSPNFYFQFYTDHLITS